MAARLKAEGETANEPMIAAQLGWDAGMHADIDGRVKMERKDEKQEARIAAFKSRVKKLTAQLWGMHVVPDCSSSEGESEDGSDKEEEEAEEEEEEEEQLLQQEEADEDEEMGDFGGGYEDEVSSDYSDS